MDGDGAKFEAATLTARLESYPAVVRALLSAVEAEEARWRPVGGAWSIVEIVCHLYDEEVEDFRRRLDLTLHHPGEKWPAIDPPRAAMERKYQERALDASLDSFVSAREESIDWLGSLESPDWDTEYFHHPDVPFTAGDLLSAWVAHDFLHLRQITKRRYEYVTRISAPYENGYAGEWRG